jgi:hypothetical protein
MPKSYKDKESLNTSKRQVDDIPRAEDPFVKGFTWAEFKNHKLLRNPAQVKVDLTKDNQVWFYLGKTSTEAKAQFTEDPAKPRHNPKGHFLDTIPKPTTTLPRQSYAATYPSSLSQNTLAATKGPIRPSQPTATSSLRAEKPYVYKPRNTGDMYRVDPQAYRSQQNFLQRSAPYSFGTDPRWRAAEPSTAPYSQNSSPVASVPPSSASHTPLAPPLQAPYRPTYTHTHTPPVPPKANNPFSGRPQTSSSRPNPFAKYSYLQKEHNRSPLEYKSPYRPGGGFMNGYQGSLEKHLQQALFRSKSGSGTPLSNPLMSFGSNLRTPYTPSQPSPSPAYSIGTPSSYGSYRTPTPQRQAEQPTINNTASNTWEKKDAAQLHPAIRQEYNSMFHHQYQPAQRPPPSQYQGPVLQPPAMYDRPQLHPSYHNHTPQARPLQQDTPQAAPQDRQQQQGMHQSVPQPPISQTIQLASSTQSPILPPSYGQYYRPLSPGIKQSPSHPPVSQPQYQPHSLAMTQSPIHASVSQPQYQASSQVYQDRPVYPHQQYFQKPEVRLQDPPQAQSPGQAQVQVLQPLAQPSQARDFPDVPADSTSIIEKMMRNLKKATPAPSATI